MLQCGARWRDCPPEYGPYTTIYNRFNRWSKRDRWQAIFAALAGHSKEPVKLVLDPTSIKAHRSSAGGKGGRRAKPSGAPAADARRKSNALTDPLCRPVAFHLTPGQKADIAAAPDVLLLATQKPWDNLTLARHLPPLAKPQRVGR